MHAHFFYSSLVCVGDCLILRCIPSDSGPSFLSPSYRLQYNTPGKHCISLKSLKLFLKGISFLLLNAPSCTDAQSMCFTAYGSETLTDHAVAALSEHGPGSDAPCRGHNVHLVLAAKT